MSDVQIAAEFGRKAFHAGKSSVPILDVEFYELINGKSNRLDLLLAWSKAWHTENLKAPV